MASRYIDYEEMCNNQLINRSNNSRLITVWEGFFALFVLLIGALELVFYNQVVCGCLLIVLGLVISLLFLQYFLGLRYNCTPLLLLHTASSALLVVLVFIVTLVALLTTDPIPKYTAWFRVSTTCVVATSVMSIVLLSSFSVSSYNRVKEIWAFETAFMEHTKRLIEASLRNAAAI